MTRLIPAAVLGAVLSVVFGTAALAAPLTLPADPTGGLMEDMGDQITTWVLTIGVPVLFALVALGIGVRFGVRWLKRAGRSV